MSTPLIRSLVDDMQAEYERGRRDGAKEARQPLLAEAVERLLNLYRATGRLPKGALQELGAALRAATGSPEA